jgi:intracellular sulfur oxidation DsrE/DsrF family protein
MRRGRKPQEERLMKRKIREIWWPWLAALVIGLGVMHSAMAETSAKPFAEKRVVLQISDPNPFKQTLVLNVANNLVKYYGPDKVDVEIVAFGPGLRLLQKDNANSDRIDGLVDSANVRFSACSNTIASFTKTLGKEPELNSHAQRVDAGVVRILELIDQGYVLIKP